MNNSLRQYGLDWLKVVRLFAFGFLFVGTLGCTHVPKNNRPVLLLLDHAESEWAALPAPVRETFTEHVQIRKASVDEIVHNPQVLESVIGFLVADLASFEPIRYLSSDPFDDADPDTLLHLFRRKALHSDSAEVFRDFFKYLESQSPRISWRGPPTWEEKSKKRLNEILLERVLLETQIGDFQPDVDDFFEVLNSLEALVRKAGADFDHPIFVVPERFHQHVVNNGKLSNRNNRLNLPPDTTLLDALRFYSESNSMSFYLQEGQALITPVYSPLPQTRIYRVNPERLAAWVDWTLNGTLMDESVSQGRVEGFPKGFSRGDIRKMIMKPSEMPSPAYVEDIFGKGKVSSISISPETGIDVMLWNFFRHEMKNRSDGIKIRWRAPDQLYVEHHPTPDTLQVEDLLYWIQVFLPGQ